MSGRGFDSRVNKGGDQSAGGGQDGARLGKGQQNEKKPSFDARGGGDNAKPPANQGADNAGDKGPAAGKRLQR